MAESETLSNPWIFFSVYCALVVAGFLVSCLFDVYFLRKLGSNCCKSSRRLVCPQTCGLYSWLTNESQEDGCFCIKGSLHVASGEQELKFLESRVDNEIPPEQGEVKHEAEEGAAPPAPQNDDAAKVSMLEHIRDKEAFVTISDSVAIIFQPWKNVRNICLAILCMIGVFIHLDELEFESDKKLGIYPQTLALCIVEMFAYFLLLAVPCCPGGIIARQQARPAKNPCNWEDCFCSSRPRPWMDLAHKIGTMLGLFILAGTNAYYVSHLIMKAPTYDNQVKAHFYAYLFLVGSILQFLFMTTFIGFNSQIPQQPNQVRTCHAFWVMLSEVLAIYLVIFFDMFGSVIRNDRYKFVDWHS
eukprot:TRINITY_DN7604_c0_g1_i1.p1 TRINITY_DN7604_c0_g1~~TRINITY_DN7604_c0_g1_i1.p1  ORF type:complete len:357 (-),score=66.01 TRINITY_DN7604_c0_g1_i1:95-1165(-)